MSKNSENNVNVLSEENVKALMDQAGETIKKSVPTQATEKPVVETEAEYRKKLELEALANEIADAVLAGDRKRVKKLTDDSMKLMDEQRGTTENGDTEAPSKIEGLKTKALGLIQKNKKVLIGTGAVVALGVIVKIALGQPTDEPEDCTDPLCDDCSNHETETV